MTRLVDIHAGDLVIVDDGWPFLAAVRDEREGRLMVRPLVMTTSFRPRPVKPTEVVCHFKLTAGDWPPTLSGVLR